MRELDFRTGDDPVTCFVTILRQTERGVLCNYDGSSEWLPKSQITNMSSHDWIDANEKQLPLDMPRWLAVEKGWVEE